MGGSKAVDREAEALAQEEAEAARLSRGLFDAAVNSRVSSNRSEISRALDVSFGLSRASKTLARFAQTLYSKRIYSEWEADVGAKLTGCFFLCLPLANTHR